MSKDIYNPDHYLNEAGYDLFEEWYIRYPFEVFRIIMWCTAERYFRRYFNKNGIEDLRKGMRVVERLEEYEERYSNEKVMNDEFRDESYLTNSTMKGYSNDEEVSDKLKEYEEKYSKYSNYDPTSEIPFVPEHTFYYKEEDVLEAVYKGLQDVSTESIYFYSRASLEELKDAIYGRLDALKSGRQW